MLDQQRLKTIMETIDECERVSGKLLKTRWSLGETMRQIRKSAGITLRDQALSIGVSASYLSDLELGRRLWTKKLVKKLMKISEA